MSTLRAFSRSVFELKDNLTTITMYCFGRMVVYMVVWSYGRVVVWTLNTVKHKMQNKSIKVFNVKNNTTKRTNKI